MTRPSPRTIGVRVAWTPEVALHLLQWLTDHNERLLEQFHLPPLYAAGVRYQREAREVWLDALSILASRTKTEDCDALAAWRAAELRVRHGLDAEPMIIAAGTGYHCLVRYWDAQGFERRDDPSFRLGMRVDNPVAYRRQVLLEDA